MANERGRREKRGLGLFLQTAVAVTGTDGMGEGGTGRLSVYLVLYRKQEKVITEAQQQTSFFFQFAVMMVKRLREWLVGHKKVRTYIKKDKYVFYMCIYIYIYKYI